MPMMTTTHGGGGITTQTSAPMPGAGGIFDINALGALLGRQLQRKFSPPVSHANVVTRAQRPAGGGGQAQPSDMEDVYVTMAGNGINAAPGYVETTAGSPGAVFSGTRRRGSGGNAHVAKPKEDTPDKQQAANAGTAGPRYVDPLGDYVTRMTEAAKQKGDGRFVVPVEGENGGTHPDYLR